LNINRKYNGNKIKQMYSYPVQLTFNCGLFASMAISCIINLKVFLMWICKGTSPRLMVGICYTWVVSRHTNVFQEIEGKRTLVMGELPRMQSKGHLIAHTLAHFSRSFDCTSTVKYNTMIKLWGWLINIRAPGTAMVVICVQVITKNPRQGGVNDNLRGCEVHPQGRPPAVPRPW